MDQRNFLHENPEAYNDVLPESENKALSLFARDIIIKYSHGKKVLDVGCGLGREIEYLRMNGLEADGVDASQQMVFEAKKRCPEASVELANMADFNLLKKYDTIMCFGSTFLYNHSWKDMMSTLSTFKKHLSPGGVLAMEMRNAAYFLTPEGQRTLGLSRKSVISTSKGEINCTSRFEIDTARQLLNRYYTWELPQNETVKERLQHRLIFPQEMRMALEISGYEILAMFDSPVPAVGEEVDLDTEPHQELNGYRLHLVARKK